MIAVKLRNGRYWEWALADHLVVNGQAISLRDVAMVEMEGVELGGRDVEVGGRAWRDLIQKDPETGISFVTSMPLEKAREVGGYLSTSGRIAIATTVPQPPA